MQALYTVMIIKVVKRYVIRINYSTFKYETIELNGTLRIGEFQVTLHFLKIMKSRPRRDRGPLFLRNGEIRGHILQLKIHPFYFINCINYLSCNKKKVCVYYLKNKENNNSAPVHFIQNSTFL